MSGMFDDPFGMRNAGSITAGSTPSMGIQGDSWAQASPYTNVLGAGLGIGNTPPYAPQIMPEPPIHSLCGDFHYDLAADQNIVFDRHGKRVPISPDENELLRRYFSSTHISKSEKARVVDTMVTGRASTNRAPIDKIKTRMIDLGMQPNTMAKYMHAFETDVSKGLFVICNDGTPLMLVDENPALFPSDALITQLRLLKT